MYVALHAAVQITVHTTVNNVVPTTSHTVVRATGYTTAQKAIHTATAAHSRPCSVLYQASRKINTPLTLMSLNLSTHSSIITHPSESSCCCRNTDACFCIVCIHQESSISQRLTCLPGTHSIQRFQCCTFNPTFSVLHFQENVSNTTPLKSHLQGNTSKIAFFYISLPVACTIHLSGNVQNMAI